MKNKTVIILIFLSLIALIIGSTLAYWTWSSNNLVTVNITTNMGGIGLTLNGGTTTVTGLAPATCTHSTYANQIPVTISRYNETAYPATTNLTLKLTSFTWTNAKPSVSDLSNVNVALTSSSSSCINPIASGNLANITVNSSASTAESQNTIVMTWNYIIPANQGTESNPSTLETYYLYVWIDPDYIFKNTGSNQIQDPLEDLSFTVTWDAESIEQVEELNPKLYDYIASNADTVTAIAFNTMTDTGLFRLSSTASDTYPVYFYRGAVTNNNVYFANKCWQIVRTTGTGGVKLIYNGENTGTSQQPECENTGSDTIIGTSEFNINNTSPADIGYMYGRRNVTIHTIGTGWYYAPDVTYSNGMYSLTSTGTYNVEQKNDISGNNLAYHHYTCGSSTETTCEQVGYVFAIDDDNDTRVFFVVLENGKKIENDLSEMLTSSDNTESSTIKTYIDDWYSDSNKGNMTGYTQYLEDTPFCNDRGIYQPNGWNPFGGALTFTNQLIFSYAGRQNAPIITCSNRSDAFTVNDLVNGNGKLTYPVGLITADEVKMANASNNFLCTGTSFWTITPSAFGSINIARIISIHSTCNFVKSIGVTETLSIRPMISLRNSMRISSGTGTITDPFIIE